MRVIPDYISNSVTVSSRTEAMLIQIKQDYYFIEYPTNLPPIPENLKVKNNKLVKLELSDFEILKDCFNNYLSLKMKKPWLHAPSYFHGYCYSQGLDLENSNILY